MNIWKTWVTAIWSGIKAQNRVKLITTVHSPLQLSISKFFVLFFFFLVGRSVIPSLLITASAICRCPYPAKASRCQLGGWMEAAMKWGESGGSSELAMPAFHARLRCSAAQACFPASWMSVKMLLMGPQPEPPGFKTTTLPLYPCSTAHHQEAGMLPIPTPPFGSTHASFGFYFSFIIFGPIHLCSVQHFPPTAALLLPVALWTCWRPDDRV